MTFQMPRFTDPGVASSAASAFENGMDRQLQRDRASFDLKEKQRNSAEQQGQDDAIRSGLRNITARPQGDAPAPTPAPAEQPSDGAGVAGSPIGSTDALKGQLAGSARTPGINPANPGQNPSFTPNIGGAIERLTRAPGGGKTALQLAQGERHRDDDGQRQAMIALANGDQAGFSYWSQRSNLNLPPQVLQDGQKAGLLAKGMLIAEKSYKDDPQQAQAFARAYVASGGNTDAAFNAAGAPLSKPHLTVHNVREGEQQVTYLLDQTRLMRHPGDPKGAMTEIGRGIAFRPLASGGGGANTQIGLATRLASMRAQAEGRQATDQDIMGALQEVRQAGSNPTARAGLELRMYTGLKTADPANLESTDEEKRAAARAFVQGALQNYAPGGVSPTAPPTNTAGGGASIPAPASPAAPPGPGAYSQGQGAYYQQRPAPASRLLGLQAQPTPLSSTLPPALAEAPARVADQPAAAPAPAPAPAAPLTGPRPTHRYNTATRRLEPVQ
jgi:hypothetical protein